MNVRQHRGDRLRSAFWALLLAVIFAGCRTGQPTRMVIYHASEHSNHENAIPLGNQAPIETSRNQTIYIRPLFSSDAGNLLRQLPVSPGDTATLWFDSVFAPGGLIVTPSKLELRKVANERPPESLQPPPAQPTTIVSAPNAVSLSSAPNASPALQMAAMPVGVRASSSSGLEYYLKIIGESLGIFVATMTLYLLARGKLKPTISNAATWLRKNGSS